MGLHLVLATALLQAKDIMAEPPTLVATTGLHGEVAEIGIGEDVVEIDHPEILMNSRRQTPVSTSFLVTPELGKKGEGPATFFFHRGPPFQAQIEPKTTLRQK